MNVSPTSLWMYLTILTPTSCWVSTATKWIASEDCRAIVERRHQSQHHHRIWLHQQVRCPLHQHRPCWPFLPATGHLAFELRHPTQGQSSGSILWIEIKSRQNRTSKTSTTTWIDWKRSEVWEKGIKKVTNRHRNELEFINKTQTAVTKT